MSRLSALWKTGLISDDWLTGDCSLADILDYHWGDYWEPEAADEDDFRIWLLKLLESDFANDIADYLKSHLEMILEKDYNWENGKRAIRSFLAKNSNK